MKKKLIVTLCLISNQGLFAFLQEKRQKQFRLTVSNGKSGLNSISIITLPAQKNAYL